MNTTQLDYFLYAFEERNFSAAARRVPVSSQGLSKGIHALEKELGVTLFTIDPVLGTPMPTEFAHELYEYCRIMNNERRLLDERFDRVRGRERARIRLGCSLGIVGVLGAKFLKEFNAQHPFIDVRYHEMTDDLVYQRLSSGDFDLGLEVGPADPYFVSEVLYRCKVYFWVNAESPLFEKDVLLATDLEGADVAIPGVGFKCFDLLKRNATDAGVQLGAIYGMSEIFQTYDFAERERGVGYTVEHLVDLPLFSRCEKVRAIPYADMYWSFCIERLPTHKLSDAEQAFWDWCLTYSKKKGWR